MAKQYQYGNQSQEKSDSGQIMRRLYVALATAGVWGVIILSWGTQRIAHYCGYHKALGKPIGEAFDTVWYWPWKFFGWIEELSGIEKIELIKEQALMAYVFPLAALFLAYFFYNERKNKGNKILHGSAKYAGYKDIKEMGYLDSSGVYIGGWQEAKGKTHHYLRHDGPEHVLVFAPTRSGKGVGLIIPTLMGWRESSIVLDIKGENHALTAGRLKSLGHKVLRLDFSDHLGTSAAHNCLAEIALDAPKTIPEVQRLANMVMDPENKGLADYWSKSGLNFFGGFVLHEMIMVQAKEKRAATLTDISILLDDPNRENGCKGLFDEMKSTDHEKILKELYSGMDERYIKAARTFIASTAQSMLSKSDKEVSGVVNTVTANLALYRDPVLAHNIRRCDFKIDDLRNFDVPVNLYLVVSPADLDRLRPLLRIFIAQVLSRFTEKMEFEDGKPKDSYKRRLLLLLDEFTSLGNVATVERAIGFQAGYGVKGYYIVQDLKQLKTAYGENSAIVANCHIRIAYAPNDLDTAKYLSAMAGTTTDVARKKSRTTGRGGGSVTISIQETARPLLTVDECMTLPGISKDGKGHITPGEMLIFTAGKNLIRGRQILYFLNPVFSGWAKIKPPGVCAAYPCGVSDSIHFQDEFDAMLEKAEGNNSIETEPVTTDAVLAELLDEEAQRREELESIYGNISYN